MLKIKYILAFGVLLSMVFACKENPFDWRRDSKIYIYTGFDFTGVKTVTGLLEIEIQDDNVVRGSWKFDKIGNPENIGSQIGSGNLSGALQDSMLYIDLNPNFIDNNVLLTANYDAQTMNGDWMYVGFPGLINHGKFSAVR